MSTSLQDAIGRWRTKIDNHLDALESMVDKEIEKEIERHTKMVEKDLTIFPCEENFNIDVWLFDDAPSRSFDLGEVLLSWFDVPEGEESTTSKEQLLQWAANLEHVANRLRQAAAEGRYANEDDL